MRSDIRRSFGQLRERKFDRLASERIELDSHEEWERRKNFLLVINRIRKDNSDVHFSSPGRIKFARSSFFHKQYLTWISIISIVSNKIRKYMYQN